MSKVNSALTAVLHAPGIQDGQRLWQLAGACPPLEQNTVYAYLLLATHFSDTCVIAEMEGEAVGYATGYLIPTRPDTLFIWQVGVAAAGRGQGLAGRMLREVLARPVCGGVRFLETTVSPSNVASRRLFHSLAREQEAPLIEEAFFAPEHFAGQAHEAEVLYRIGPLGVGPD